jgi:hypothetical protein
MGGELEEINATDSIEYGMTYLRADQSIFKDLGIFLQRDRSAGIMFYYIDTEKTIGIETNFGKTEITISDDTYVELTQEPDSLSILKIQYMDEELDLTQSYLRIKKSLVQHYMGEPLRPFF